MESKQLRKYYDKAKDSFKTKKNLFIFSLAMKKESSFSNLDFINFKISKDLVIQYTTEYWQQEELDVINHQTVREIYNLIQSIKEINQAQFKVLETEYVKSFPGIFPETMFLDLINTQSCHYCGITIDKIELLADKKRLYKKTLRGWSLEIDRINSNLEYTPSNCVLACYWCNNAKTDEFTEAEFIEIGKVINSIWEKRLQ